MIGLWALAFADLRIILQLRSGDGWSAARWVIVSPYLGTLAEGQWVAVPA